MKNPYFQIAKIALSNGRWKYVLYIALGSFFLNIIIGIVTVNLILQPINDVIRWTEQAVEDVGMFFQRLGNWFASRGWSSNDEAFHDRLKQLGDQNDLRIDLPLIASTLYYPYDVGFDKDVSGCFSSDETANSKTECTDYYRNNPDADQNVGNEDRDKQNKALNVDRLNTLVNNIKTDGITGPDYNKYDTYLREHYIKESPEYEYSWGLTEEEASERIEVIIQDIHARAKFYSSLFPPRQICQVAFGNDRVRELMISGYLITPVRGTYSITSCFGPRVLKNSDGTTTTENHKGTDIAIDPNTDKNIYAAGSGILITSVSDCTPGGQCGDRGNYVIVAHKFDYNDYIYETIYQHLASVDPDLLAREKITDGNLTGIPVNQGDLIGVEGNTGHVLPAPTPENPSAGTHLHFEFLMSSESNPTSFSAVNAVSLFPDATSLADNCVVVGGSANYNIPAGSCSSRIVYSAESIFYNRNPIYKRSNLGYSLDNTLRSNTYNNIPSGGPFKTDCNGFVGLVLRDALQIGPKMGNANAGDLTTFTFFSPGSYHGVWGPRTKDYATHFNFISTGVSTSDLYMLMTNGQVKAGDILGFNNGDSTHVAVYAGNNKIIENTGSIRYRDFKQSNHWSDGSTMTVWRCIDNPMDSTNPYDDGTVSTALGGAGKNCPAQSLANMQGDPNCTDPNTKVCVTVNGSLYSLETYVTGVLYHELAWIHNYPDEALKAQTVAIRTYAFSRGEVTEQAGRIFVDMGTASAATQTFGLEDYLNYSSKHPDYKAKIENVINTTAGQVRIYNGKIFSTEYTACTADEHNHHKKPMQAGDLIDPYCDMNYYNEYLMLTDPGFRLFRPFNAHNHNRGMSQFGSGYLAGVRHENYAQILDYYYYGQTVPFDPSYLP